jgi:hypothetical protein
VDRKIGSEIGSCISENWIAGTHDPFFGKLDRVQPASQPASQPATQVTNWPAGRRGHWASRPTSQPAVGHPPSHGGPARVAGWLARWLMASWPAGPTAACGSPPSWLAGQLASQLAMAGRPGLWLPGRLVWLTCSDWSVSWLDFAGNLSHLQCSRHQCLQPSPHACDMDVG